MKIWYKKIFGDLCYCIEVNEVLIDISKEQAQQFIDAGIEVQEGDF